MPPVHGIKLPQRNDNLRTFSPIVPCHPPRCHRRFHPDEDVDFSENVHRRGPNRKVLASALDQRACIGRTSRGRALSSSSPERERERERERESVFIRIITIAERDDTRSIGRAAERCCSKREEELLLLLLAIFPKKGDPSESEKKKCLALTSILVHFQAFGTCSRDKVKFECARKSHCASKQRTTKNCDNVRLNHENCVFGWNLGFFHVHEQQRYALLRTFAFYRLESGARFFFSFSRIGEML